MILQDDTLRRDRLDHGTFIESGTLFVFTHVDEDESVLRIAAVYMDVQMHVRELQQALRSQIIEGGIRLGDVR